MRIGLVADIPNEPVFGRVEHVVQRDGQLDDAESSAEMPARRRDGADRFGSQFVGYLSKVRLVVASQVSRALDAIEHVASLFRKRNKRQRQASTPSNALPKPR